MPWHPGAGAGCSEQRPGGTVALGYIHTYILGGRYRDAVSGERIAIEIWSNYQDYICARLKFADPTPDKQRANEDEAVTNAAEQELHAQRYAIQAYLHRTHQPLELGV